jgi:hypothetical protein
MKSYFTYESVVGCLFLALPIELLGAVLLRRGHLNISCLYVA